MISGRKIQEVDHRIEPGKGRTPSTPQMTEFENKAGGRRLRGHKNSDI